jgi:hypothetical protein
MASMGKHAETVRLLRVDMGPAEAEMLAQEFREFATWLNALPPEPLPIGRGGPAES